MVVLVWSLGVFAGCSAWVRDVLLVGVRVRIFSFNLVGKGRVRLKGYIVWMGAFWLG